MIACLNPTQWFLNKNKEDQLYMHQTVIQIYANQIVLPIYLTKQTTIRFV